MGVNRYEETEPSPLTEDAEGGILVVDPAVEAEAQEALERVARAAGRRAVDAALAELARVAASDENVMPATIAAARAGATTGEWAADAARRVRLYRAPTGVGEAAAPAPGEELAALRDDVAALSESLGRRLKILVGKPGLDGHSNGAEQIAVRARDAGMEVVYEGIRLTPSQIARSAVDEGVHVIGLSILSGSHRELIPSVIAALREAGGEDIPLVVGGIIPDADVAPAARGGRRRGLHAEGLRAHAHPARRGGAGRGAQRHRQRRGVSAGDAGAPGGGGRPRPPPRRARPLRRARGAEPRREPVAAARAEIAALLGAVSPAALGGEAPAHVVGVTGPPGAGKSTLLSALVRGWRATGRSVAVLAVDPSSKRCGGALLGDRARIDADPADRGVFIRSMAAGERLGGLAPATRAAAQALAAAFDIVVIETVGVGQSETEVAEAADTVAVIVQPGSGDALQFLKSGIMEVPDALVVTKADLGAVASARGPRPPRRAALARRRDDARRRGLQPPPASGIDELIAALDAHRAGLDLAAARVRTRRLGALADFIAEHGARGLRGARRPARRRSAFLAEQPPEADEPALVAALEARAAP